MPSEAKWAVRMRGSEDYRAALARMALGMGMSVSRMVEVAIAGVAEKRAVTLPSRKQASTSRRQGASEASHEGKVVTPTKVVTPCTDKVVTPGKVVTPYTAEVVTPNGGKVVTPNPTVGVDSSTRKGMTEADIRRRKMLGMPC